MSEQSSSPVSSVSSARPLRGFDASIALLEVLARVPDPRDPRGVRHPLLGIVEVAVCAVVAGSRSFASIAQWAGELAPADLTRLGLRRSAAPKEATFRRLLARLDAVLLDSLIGAFMWTRTSIVAGRRVIAIDGKTLRGARTKLSTAPHLVAALDHATGVVVGQLATAAKSNEIPTVRTLLATFEIHGVVITVDAMHTQTDTATAIVAAGGDYVFTVKGNQPTLYAACKALPWKDVPAHSTVQKGHGRRAHRSIKVLTAPAWITFAGAAQVAQIRPDHHPVCPRRHEEDRRGRLRHHLRRSHRRTTNDSRDMGSGSLGD